MVLVGPTTDLTAQDARNDGIRGGTERQRSFVIIAPAPLRQVRRFTKRTRSAHMVKFQIMLHAADYYWVHRMRANESVSHAGDHGRFRSTRSIFHLVAHQKSAQTGLFSELTTRENPLGGTYGTCAAINFCRQVCHRALHVSTIQLD